ncbi:MAG: hypothetical protein LAT65_18195 [Saccharospirillum sp.]|nr:hypothetical protein [Saccharospirillum sp.]
MGRKVANSSRSQKAVLRRPRLNQTLESITSERILWLVAAGGYGKTTLALDFLSQRKINHLYLPIPKTALGIGEWFFSLRQRALDSFGETALALPVLTPEYAASVDRLAEHFTQKWLDITPVDSAVFLDDVQNLPETHPVQTLVIHFAESLLNAGHRILLASRQEPPSIWARLRAQNLLAFIDEDDLVFRDSEQQALLDQHNTHLAPGLKALSLETRGWAAGLMLLMEHSRRPSRQDEQHLLQRNIRDWFEQEVFAPLDEEARQLLMRAVWVRHIPKTLVNEVTELTHAQKRLEQLYLDHAFIREENHPDLGPGYVLHDLFREFLLQRSESLLSAAQRQRWQLEWGHALWRAGDWSEAATLLQDSGATQSLAQGLREQGGTLLQQGRGDQLYQWLQALPSSLVDEDPYLQVWLGLCLLLTDTRSARAHLTSAWTNLTQQQDSLHMALAWSGIVDSIWLEWAHISEYTPWIDALLAVEDGLRSSLPEALWYRVVRGMLTALGYARPGSDELKRWHQEGLSAISKESIPADERLMLASQLMYLSTWQFGRRADAAAVVSIINESPHLVRQAGPLAQCLWATFDSLWSLLFEADQAACLAKAEHGRELIRTHGISTWDNAIPPIHCALCFHDNRIMNDWAGWFMRTELKAHRPFYDTFQAHVLAGQAWLSGHLPEALDHAERSLETMHRHGSEAITAGFESIYASLLSEAGHYPQALRSAARARKAFRSFDSGFVDVMVYLTLARIPLHRRQPERALPFIRRAFHAGARERLFFPIQIRDQELATLAALALRENIEPDYVYWLISARKLLPPTHCGLRQSWPWPCQLQVMGQFDVKAHGQLLGRLPQKRTRALLSELILAGKDGLPLEQLSSALWPDSDPDKAANSLHVTTHRVRDALRNANALIVEAGQVRLNPHQVWVDCWELEGLAQQARQLTHPVLQQAVNLFSGRLHLEVLDETQAAIYQETLNQHYLTLVLTLSKQLEQADSDQARQHYRRALRHLPLEQALWSGLLRTEAKQGNARTLELTFEQAKAHYKRELDAPPPEPLVATYRKLTSL